MTPALIIGLAIVLELSAVIRVLRDILGEMRKP